MMKEKVILVLDDIDDFDLTLKQILVVMEKIMHHYIDTDLEKFIQFVEGFMIYFYKIYQLFNGGENNENGIF